MPLHLKSADEDSDLEGVLAPEEPETTDADADEQRRAAVQALESQILLLSREKDRLLAELEGSPASGQHGTLPEDEE